MSSLSQHLRRFRCLPDADDPWRSIMPPFVEVAAEPVDFFATAVGSTVEGPRLMLVFGDDLDTGQVFALTMPDALHLAADLKRVLVEHALKAASS
jgi:hypothetical protein